MYFGNEWGQFSSSQFYSGAEKEKISDGKSVNKEQNLKMVHNPFKGNKVVSTKVVIIACCDVAFF